VTAINDEKLKELDRLNDAYINAQSGDAAAAATAFDDLMTFKIANGFVEECPVDEDGEPT